MSRAPGRSWAWTIRRAPDAAHALLLRNVLGAALLLGLPATPAGAQPAARIEQLLAVLNGGGSVGEIFTPAFLGAIPEQRLRALAARVAAEAGRARAVARQVWNGGTVMLEVTYDRATVPVTMTLEGGRGARIAGLVISGPIDSSATVAEVLDRMRALPGSIGVAAVRFDGDRAVPLARLSADRPFAVGSTFKLLVLAELVRAVNAGERRWDDVVRLGPRSIPSGILQDWPAGAPITLHSLATLMISRSDNSATDTLLAVLGRDRVAAMATPLGWPVHPGNDPLLFTAEVARLKGAPDRSLAARYAAASPADRREMLRAEVAAIPLAGLDLARISAAPTRIDSIEWFASPDALVRTLDWFRRSDDPVAATIMAVNAGLPPSVSGAYAYVGYKGGSEAGVMNMTYLLRTRDGRAYAVTGSWNDPAAALMEGHFSSLMARLVQLIARRPA